MGGLGGFGGLFDLKAAGFKDPILVSGTDGVGTKLKVAIEAGIPDTVGIDLVAMCVNDIVVQGAEPLFFLDYYASGKLDVEAGRRVVAGIAEGCRRAGCALVGGETAEMPGMYADGDYDLAGFSVGAAERDDLLPRADIAPGDVVLGLASSGAHSNGYSLVRRIVARSGLGYDAAAPFAKGSLGQALLEPTRIYVKPLLAAMRATGAIKGLAHITGGGLPGNVPRCLPDGMRARLDARQWSAPAVFRWLREVGQVPTDDMLRTFNCGLGMIVVTARRRCRDGRQGADRRRRERVHGRRHRARAAKRSRLRGRSRREPMAKLKVGILISGRGSNMAALIEAAKAADYPAEIAVRGEQRGRRAGPRRSPQDAGVATAAISHSGFPDRESFDRAVSAELEKHGVGLVALAGFMRIQSPWFPAHWKDRIINIHPSLLPAFPGLHVQQQAIDAGARISGCTVHFVTADLDAGPIIAQAAVPVLPGRRRRHARRAHPAPGAPALSDGRALVRRGPPVAQRRTSRSRRRARRAPPCSSRPTPSSL